MHVIIKAIGVKPLSIWKENMMTIIAVVIAIIVGVTIQQVYDLPLIVTAVISLVLGLFIGFIVRTISAIVGKHNEKKKNK